MNEAHVTLLSRAFAGDPMFTHLFTGKKGPRQVKSLIRFLLKRNQFTDGLLLTDHPKNPSCVALIERPSHTQRVSFINTIRLAFAVALLSIQLPFRVLKFLTKYQKLTAAAAPVEPHYYVTMIGVAPEHQGKCIGKAVLTEIHALAAASTPAYPVALDTENARNTAYYERLGYELTAVKEIDGLPIYCMTRPAE